MVEREVQDLEPSRRGLDGGPGIRLIARLDDLRHVLCGARDQLLQLYEPPADLGKLGGLQHPLVLVQRRAVDHLGMGHRMVLAAKQYQVLETVVLTIVIDVIVLQIRVLAAAAMAQLWPASTNTSRRSAAGIAGRSCL